MRYMRIEMTKIHNSDGVVGTFLMYHSNIVKEQGQECTAKFGRSG